MTALIGMTKETAVTLTSPGVTILTMIILTVVFNFGMMLLLVMTVIVFIIIVILTNMCTMIYQL